MRHIARTTAPQGPCPASRRVAAALFVLLPACGGGGSGKGGIAPSARRFLMHEARYGAATVVLPNGDVLVAGGHDETGAPLSSAEVFDQSLRSDGEAGNEMVRTGSMAVPRAFLAAVPLRDGQVLVAGGGPDTLAERYLPDPGNPSRGRFVATAGGLLVPRRRPAAVPLADGRVLVAGGDDGRAAGPAPLASAEVYDPGSDRFAATGPMETARAEFTLTRLPGGRVLAAGGRTASGDPTGAAEIYDPATGRWTRAGGAGAGGLGIARFAHASVLMTHATPTPDDDLVLLAGGTGAGGAPVREAEFFDPASLRFSVAGDVAAPAASDLAALALLDGSVLLLGGFSRRDGGIGEPRGPTRETALVRVLPSPATTAGAQDLPFRVGGMGAAGIGRSGTHTGTEVFVAGGRGEEGSALRHAFVFDPFDVERAQAATLGDQEMLISSMLAAIFGLLDDGVAGFGRVDLRVREDPVRDVIVTGDLEGPDVDLEFDAGSIVGEAATETFALGIEDGVVRSRDLRFTFEAGRVTGSMKTGRLRHQIDVDRFPGEVEGLVWGTNNSALAEFRLVFSGSGTDPLNSWVKIRY